MPAMIPLAGWYVAEQLKAQAAALGIEGTAFFVGDGFAKLFRMPANRVIGQHVHKSDHLGMLLLGTVRITADGEVTEHVAPTTLVLPAGMAHQIESVTDALWACVWPDADGAVTEEDLERKVIA